MVRVITNAEVHQAAEGVSSFIRGSEAFVKSTPLVPLRLFGVPRGGIIAAYAVKAALPRDRAVVIESPIAAHFIIDDIRHTGKTEQRFKRHSAPFLTLFEHEGEWLEFPWEVAEGSAVDIPIRLLGFIGEDFEREGLRETPDRFLKAWSYWTKGYKEKPSDILKTFQDGSQNYDEMVFQGAIPLWSICEHHLAPFFGLAHVGYIPGKSIVGLSKLARIVDVFARRLQVQERLTSQIADCLFENLKPLGVGVVLECRHSCMESRGIEKMGTVTVTSALRGAMKGEHETRSEFLAFVRSARPGSIV